MHSHWWDIGATDTILSWLKEDVPVFPSEKTSTPPPPHTHTHFHLDNPLLSPAHTPFVRQELKDLLQAGFIDTCQEPPRFVYPLLK